MLTDVCLLQGPAGIRELQIGVNDPLGMEKSSKEKEASAQEAAAVTNGNGSDPGAVPPTVESLVEIGVLSRDADDVLCVDFNFEQSLE